MTVTRSTRDGYDVIECDVCRDHTCLTGREEWRDDAEQAFRFRHPDADHLPPSMQPKPRKKP